jgi:hypothetical protein
VISRRKKSRKKMPNGKKAAQREKNNRKNKFSITEKTAFWMFLKVNQRSSYRIWLQYGAFVAAFWSFL